MVDFSESTTEVEVRIRLPAGTKRTELHIALEDATGTNLWRNEWSEYAAGGNVQAVVGATLRVQPVSWTTALLAGTLRGSVDPRECSFAVLATANGESCLQISLAKGAAGSWGGLLLDALDVPDPRVGSKDAAGPTEQELLETMALHLTELPVQLRCAWRCCELARQGQAMTLVSQALPQVAEAMRQHAGSPAMQVTGCGLLASLPLGLNTLCRCAALESGLLAETVAAMRERAPQHAPLQLLGTQALLGLAAAGDSCLDALVASGALASLVTSLALQPPTRELACRALTLLARGGTRVQRGLLRAGAARALLEGASHVAGCAAWQLRCLVALHELTLTLHPTP